MKDDEKHAASLMHAALTEILAYAEDPNMPMETLKERAAQAVLVAEQAIPGIARE